MNAGEGLSGKYIPRNKPKSFDVRDAAIEIVGEINRTAGAFRDPRLDRFHTGELPEGLTPLIFTEEKEGICIDSDPFGRKSLTMSIQSSRDGAALAFQNARLPFPNSVVFVDSCGQPYTLTDKVWIEGTYVIPRPWITEPDRGSSRDRHIEGLVIENSVTHAPKEDSRALESATIKIGYWPHLWGAISDQDLKLDITNSGIKVYAHISSGNISHGDIQLNHGSMDAIIQHLEKNFKKRK